VRRSFSGLLISLDRRGLELRGCSSGQRGRRERRRRGIRVELLTGVRVLAGEAEGVRNGAADHNGSVQGLRAKLSSGKSTAVELGRWRNAAAQ
jgi:hypothetical protein